MRKLFILFLIASAGRVAAQTEFSTYRLGGNLAQANMLNPAFAPNNKVVIGLPVISGLYASSDMDGIAFRDIFKEAENDSLKLDTLSLFSKLKTVNRIKLKESVQLFYFGLRGQKGYFSFGVHHITEARIHYPGDVVGWGIRGPGNHRYVGKPLDLGLFYGKGIAYNKVSVNYGRDITKKLRVGARFNYLMGMATAETTKVEGNLRLGIDSVNINTGALQVQTSGIEFFRKESLKTGDYVNYILKGNTGMAWDFGATYNVTDNLTLSAAVNDLGYISWKTYNRSYDIAPVNYTFKGFDLLDYLNQGQGQDFLQAELDSVKNLYTATEVDGKKFNTSLIGKFYAGVNFRVLRVNNFSLLFYADMFQKRIDPAISLGYNLQLGRLLNATLGITYQNGNISNVGAGLALKLTTFQFYATSDRANSAIYPARASRHDAHIGVNLVFGKVKKKGDDEEKEDEEEEAKTDPQAVAEAPKDTAQVAKEPQVTNTDVAIPESGSGGGSAVIPVAAVATSALIIAERKTDNPEPEQKPETEQATEPERAETIGASDTPVDTPVAPAVAEAPVDEGPIHETVKRGTHREELPVSHYVIVGTFRQRGNAQRYSRQLNDAGYGNEFGFVSAKKVYYVFVQRSDNADEARSTRDEFRTKSEFQFARSWVLSVED